MAASARTSQRFMTPAAAPEAPRILVVDDDEGARALLREALQLAGYRVSVAIDGEELLDMLFATPRNYFAAVVCDQVLPGLRGTECLSRASSHARFIIITGVSDRSVEKSAAQFGAVGFFRKPVDLDRLLTLLDSIASPSR